MLKLKLITIGSSVGVILPKEALARLKVDKGDSIFLTGEKGGFRVTHSIRNSKKPWSRPAR